VDFVRKFEFTGGRLVLTVVGGPANTPPTRLTWEKIN
jgi:hypothetical protein